MVTKTPQPAPPDPADQPAKGGGDYRDRKPPVPASAAKHKEPPKRELTSRAGPGHEIPHRQKQRYRRPLPAV